MSTSAKTSRSYKWLVLAGGFALLGAMLVELLAVIGRRSGFPLPGSIELVQVLVTFSGTTALVIATLRYSHANVRLLKDRFGRPGEILGALLSALFFMVLGLGSVAIAMELWPGFEESEIWHVPYRPLRIIVSAGMLVVAALFLLHSFRRQS